MNSLQKTGRLFIGTSGWYYKDWLGPFYPQDLPTKQYLQYYSTQFNTVEIDSTFYRIPSAKMVENWYHITPESFSFSPKFPKIITHEKRLQHCESELYLFLEQIGLLREKLGVLVLQFDYTFKPDQLPLLADFLAILPKEFRYAVEIRNRSWLKNEAFFRLLEQHRMAFVMQDLYYMPGYYRVTAPFVYIRLLGNRKLIPDDFSHARIDKTEALEAWAERIVTMISEGMDVFAYSNNRYQGHAPSTVRSLLQKIDDRF